MFQAKTEQPQNAAAEGGATFLFRQASHEKALFLAIPPGLVALSGIGATTDDFDLKMLRNGLGRETGREQDHSHCNLRNISAPGYAGCACGFWSSFDGGWA